MAYQTNPWQAPSDQTARPPGRLARAFGIISALAIIVALVADGTSGWQNAQGFLNHIPAVRRASEEELIGKLNVNMTYDQIKELLGKEPYQQALSKGRIYQFDREWSLIQVVVDDRKVVRSVGVFIKDSNFKPDQLTKWGSPFGRTIESFVTSDTLGDEPTKVVNECGMTNAAYILVYDRSDSAHDNQHIAVGVTTGVPGSTIAVDTPCEWDPAVSDCRQEDLVDDQGSTDPKLPECITEIVLQERTKISMMVITRPEQPITAEMLCRPEVVLAGTCPEASWLTAK